MVQELCHCGTLNSLLRQQVKLAESVARIYTCEIITALGYMHFNEIIYRDLKPENILIEESGHVKLSNFGLSTAVTEISKAAEF